jgi:transmembrane sensor
MKRSDLAIENHIASQPMAGGHAIALNSADQAAEWLTLMMSAEMDEADRQRWLQWRQEHSDNERAWLHLENTLGKLKALPTQAAYRALSTAEVPPSLDRRKVMRALCLAGAFGIVAVSSRSHYWNSTLADYSTATGEQRDIMLDDGTRIVLNTGTAINVRFDAVLRLVHLVQGEIMVTTGHPPGDQRPFAVDTADGRIRALGTRFNVRQTQNGTHVTVLESAVEITYAASPTPVLLQAGEQALFTRHTLEKTPAAPDEADAWTRGQLIAANVRLGDFINDLDRYRKGILRCDPAVADLRFSGVFSLNDTDYVLSILPNSLPIRVQKRTRYWVTIQAAG